MGDLITSGEIPDLFIRVDVYDDRIVRTARVARLFSHKMPARLNPYTETSATLLFQKNSKGESYLVGHREDNTELPFHLLASLFLSEKNVILPFMEEQLIALYNRVSSTNFESILTLRRIDKYEIFSLLSFPLLRHQTPDSLDIHSTSSDNNGLENVSVWNIISTTIRYEPKAVNVLREATTMKEFCDLFFPSHALATPLDYEIGSKVSGLWWIASWNMGITLTEQYEHSQAFTNVMADYISDVFPFLFNWLDGYKRERLLEHILRSVEMRALLPHVSPLPHEKRRTIAYFPQNINQLMLDEDSKRQLAIFLFEYIITEKVCDFDRQSLESLWYAVAQWYTINVKMPHLVSSEYSKEDVKALWALAFGEMVAQEEESLFNSPYGLEAMTLSVANAARPTALWNQISDLCIDNEFIPHFDINTIIHPESGELERSFPSMMSYDEFIGRLSPAIENIDNMLKKNHIDLTTENRRIYLSIDGSFRDRETLWLLVSWGLTDINHINALLATGEKDINELKRYTELPQDIFYELFFNMSTPSSTGSVVQSNCLDTIEKSK